MPQAKKIINIPKLNWRHSSIFRLPLDFKKSAKRVDGCDKPSSINPTYLSERDCSTKSAIKAIIFSSAAGLYFSSVKDKMSSSSSSSSPSSSDNTSTCGWGNC